MTSFHSVDMLLLTYYFPPIKSVGVLRNYYLHREMKKYFRQVHVLTTSNRTRLTQEQLPFTAGSLLVAPTFDYRTIGSFIEKGQTHISEEKKRGWILWLLKINDSFPFNLLFGEGGFVYIIYGTIKAVRLIRKTPVSHVYSSFRPYSDHVIAWLLTLFFPKKITWIADFRDLHVDPMYRHIVWESLQHRVWRRLLSRAALVTTVSEGLAKHLRRYHPRVHVMRNGIGQLTPVAGDEVLQQKKFTIAYTGSMDGDERDPAILLKALQQLIHEKSVPGTKIQLHHAGKDSAMWKALMRKYGLAELLCDEGMVPLKKSGIIQRSAHINLLLTSARPDSTGAFTGKFYEYLAARHPILLIINGSEDEEFETVFAQTNAGHLAYAQDGSIAAVKDFILAKYSEWDETGKVAPVIAQKDIESFRWPHLAKELIAQPEFSTNAA
ncbi:MAG: hypothetical protein ACE5FF_09745 [Saprospiraceae bacterium]